MMAATALELYDPRNGDLALKIEAIRAERDLNKTQRFNYFTIYWIQEGCGQFWADLAQHSFQSHCLLFFVPYQAILLNPTETFQGLAIQFHANFLCIETYHEEVGCNGVLFNDLYGVPAIHLDAVREKEFAELIGLMRREISEEGLAHVEILLSYLKIFLVRASRLKLEQQTVGWQATDKLPSVLNDFKALLEAEFRTLHSPADYAERLFVSSKTLAKSVKTYYHKTLTDLIRERVLKQAKWDLLHTLKPVKQIAGELGFDDEFYFSRLFKKATGCAPTFFREFETQIRGGRNLSMPLRPPSIPAPSSPL